MVSKSSVKVASCVCKEVVVDLNNTLGTESILVNSAL